MKHDCCKIGVAAATAVAIGYTLCALFVHINPQHALQLSAQLMHLTSTEPLAPYVPYLHITAENYISGVVQSFIYSFALVWGSCCLYGIMFTKRGK